MELDELEISIASALKKPPLDWMLVVEACHELSQRIASGRYDEPAAKLLPAGYGLREKMREAACMLDREALIHRVRTELGPDYGEKVTSVPPFGGGPVTDRICPLGVLFHIAAGNLDGLPAYSVVEGLLAGNVNLLKLPSSEHGVSGLILEELISIRPELEDYIHVFDLTSADLVELKRLTGLADGISVWGGDEAVRAVRAMAGPGVKLMEWGNKISFAYVTEQGMNEEELKGLARHMVKTRQVLCSSCQGIYVDTDDSGRLDDFSRRFVRALEGAAGELPRPDPAERARSALEVYTMELEGIFTKRSVYRGRDVSVTRAMDPAPELSLMFGNCWVKPLPRYRIVETLMPYRRLMQTVGLLCGEEERGELSDLLIRGGAVRITRGAGMSESSCGEAHDGELPLRRYTRMVRMM